MRFLGLIPARGGSKGIPNKCIVPCAGKPLLFYTAKEAKKSRHLNRLILSTDSKKIAAVGRRLGLEVPFLRPAVYAKDVSPMMGVLQHALSALGKQGDSFEAVVLLQPTSPLRTSRHIDDAIRLFKTKKADTVVSVVEVPHPFTPGSLVTMRKGRLSPYLKRRRPILRRQDKPMMYARNGPAILVIRADLVRKGILYGPKTFGYLMSSEVSNDIDTPQDLVWAEHLLEAG